MNWIKTSDRLPEKDGMYIVTQLFGDIIIVEPEAKFTVDGFVCSMDNKVIEPMTFYEEEGVLVDGCYEPYHIPINVIAWMPFPEPYNPNND